MFREERKWLAPVNWDQVVELNKKLCPGAETPHRPSTGYEMVKSLWETSAQKAMSLQHTLDLCRKCHLAKPFAFFNGNTFALLTQNILKDVFARLPSLDAQILKSTAAHYVAGSVSSQELNKICDHIESLLTQKPGDASGAKTGS